MNAWSLLISQNSISQEMNVSSRFFKYVSTDLAGRYCYVPTLEDFMMYVLLMKIQKTRGADEI